MDAIGLMAMMALKAANAAVLGSTGIQAHRNRMTHQQDMFSMSREIRLVVVHDVLGSISD
jgi:hypothetical protein